MIELKNIQRVYFIGIGGIGMSALARYFYSLGKLVFGYDKTESVLSRQLVLEGMSVHYSDDIELLDKHTDLVIYTPAIPKNHLELNWYRQHNYAVIKRSDALQIITEEAFSICIAGTHGKTSISTMVANLLTHSGYGCNAFLGGISVNYQTNFWSSENNVCVVEADEYDRSFLKLNPDIAVITSMDADHLDIYGTADAVEEAFIEFAGKVKTGGLLIRHQKLKQLEQSFVRRQVTYCLQKKSEGNIKSSEDSSDVFAENILIVDGGYSFDVHINAEVLKSVKLNIGGLHNIENALAAITVAKSIGISDEKIKSGLSSFLGVKRRFEYVVKHLPDNSVNRVVFIDDYAHHPAELEALIHSAKHLFPNMSCTIIFQPHLFSRTRDFANEFASALSLADHVLLLPIYPAREQPIEGVTNASIAELMPMDKVMLVTKNNLYDKISDMPIELLITAGAGDIDTLISDLKSIVIKKYNLS